jgi:hypothetical protein
MITLNLPGCQACHSHTHTHLQLLKALLLGINTANHRSGMIACGRQSRQKGSSSTTTMWALPSKASVLRLARSHLQHPSSGSTIGVSPMQWAGRGSTTQTIVQPRSRGQDRQHTTKHSVFETLLLNPSGSWQRSSGEPSPTGCNSVSWSHNRLNTRCFSKTSHDRVAPAAHHMQPTTTY